MHRPEGPGLHERSVNRHADIWVLGIAMSLALALRLPKLGDGLWFDEIQTLVDYVRHPLGQIITTFDSQNQHLLYSVLARLSIVLGGESPEMLRLPALLLGVASLPAFFVLARRVGPRDEAIAGLFALGVSYHHVWFSQNARGYTGLLLFSLLATAELHRILTTPNATSAGVVRYGVWLALALYTHSTAGALVVAHVAVIAAVGWSRWRTDRAGWLKAIYGLATGAGLTLLLYGPVLSQVPRTLIGASVSTTTSEWQSPIWLITETIRGLSQGLPGGWIAVLTAFLVMIAGLVSYWRQDRILTALLVLPGAITAAVVIGTGHNLWPRFFFFSAGFAILIVIRGAFELGRMVLGERRRAVLRALAAVALVASAVTVPRAWGPKQDFDGALQFVEQSRSPADAVVTVDLTSFPYQRYYDRDWPTVPNRDSLEKVERTHSRTWLLSTFPIRLAAVAPDVWNRVRQSYDTAAVFPGTVGGGVVMVMVSRRDSTVLPRQP